MEMQMNDVMSVDAYTITVSMMTKIILALTAHVVIRMSLSHFDRTLGFSFKDWITNASDQARAQYLGFRILAVSILFGLIMGL